MRPELTQNTIYRWTKEYTDKINRIQFHSPHHHPLTCVNRSEPGHEHNGRDLAILVAKQEGYLECPYCGQKQHWLPEGYISESQLKLTPDDIEYHESPAAFMQYKKEKQKQAEEEGESIESFVKWTQSQPKEAEPSKAAVAAATDRWKQVQIDNAHLLGVPVDEYLAEDAPFFLKFRKEPPLLARSALMNRLLNGKDPLPYPPPKSDATPWYSLVEDNEVHRVSLDLGRPTMLAVDSYVKASQLGQLFINGNGWDIVSTNDDAEAFLDLMETQWVEVDGKHVRPDDYAEKALAIAFGNPEFIVKDRFYGEFRVWYSLTGHTMSGCRYTIYKPIMELFLLADDLRGINPVVTRVISECDPDRVAEGFGEMGMASRPELDHDWCEFTCGGWLMEKIHS